MLHFAEMWKNRKHLDFPSHPFPVRVVAAALTRYGRKNVLIVAVNIIWKRKAGFSYAKADELRRAMSKKKEDLLLSYKDDFISGGLSYGYDEKTLNEVYNLILKFANYGFNKAHSVSYAIIGYKIAYLKVHYSVYFETELLNNSISSSNKTKSIIDECKSLGEEVTGPIINISTDKYNVIEDKLVLPLSLIKGIGVLTAKEIVRERDLNGSFTSYLDFVRR